MKRVLVVARERVGTEMAGPGIRYFHFASELARRGHEITLVIPNDTAEVTAPFDVVQRPSHGLGELLTRADVVVAQHLGLREMRRLAGSRTRTIYDLYVPFLTENLPLHASEDAGAGADVYRTTNLVQLTALATGDAFVCASERQRDLWLGSLGALGRIGLDAYRADATLRSLIDVVPFGLDPEPPRRTQPAVKGVVDGIGGSDKVLLWAGGIWNWFDPLTVIRAVASVAKRRDDVRLFFLAPGGIEGGPKEMQMAHDAKRLAGELGLADRVVFFNDGWVPYVERAGYLLDADLGVSAHLDTVETRFAFRTRLLDHFWAGLPSLVTGGDALGELVERRELGAALPAGDVEAWSRAIVDWLDDDAKRERAAANCASVAEELAWPVVTEPLARLVADGTPSRPARAASMRLTLDYVGRGVTAAVKNRRLAAEWWNTRRGA